MLTVTEDDEDAVLVVLVAAGSLEPLVSGVARKAGALHEQVNP